MPGRATAPRGSEQRSDRGTPRRRVAVRASALAAGVVLAATACLPPEVPRTNEAAVLGTQFGSHNDWTSNIPFVDVMKSARPLFSGTASAWSDGRALDLDADGWVRSLQPGQVARTSVLTRVSGYPAGDWALQWEGTGTVRSVRGTTTVIDAQRSMVHLTGAEGGTTIEITATDPADPVRDIELTPPGGVCRDDGTVAVAGPADCPADAYLAFAEHADTILFTPRFLDQVRDFRALRFLAWQGVNTPGNSGATGVWAQRRRVESATWWGEVPIEVLLDLANRVHADPWINVPHLADDAYVDAMATMVRDRLDPDLDAWVEFSNEVWNPVFPQTTWARDQGVAAGLSTDPNLAGLRFYARRASQVMDRFTAVVGADRLQRVLATQAANSWSAQQVLAFEGAASHADVLAIAPYFGGEIGRRNELAWLQTATVDDLFVRLETESLPTALDAIETHVALADQYGLRLDAYESGQHLTPPFGSETDPALAALFGAANRDPRMGDLYTRSMEAWRDLGGGLMMTFVTVETPFQGSNWGMLETMTQEHSAKWDAVATFNSANTVWWTE